MARRVVRDATEIEILRQLRKWMLTAAACGGSEAEQIPRGVQLWLHSKDVKAERKRADTRKRS